MGIRQLVLVLLAFGLLAPGAPAGPPIGDSPAKPARPDPADAPGEDDDAADGGLGMTRAILCVTVEGYEDYVERPDARLTADEKLVIYFRPLRFATERVADGRQAHLIQDARIRRRGGKAALQILPKILDFKFKARGPGPVGGLYMSNTISVSELKPGDYDLDITLHDAVAGGPVAKQVVRFAVVAEPGPRDP